MNDDNPYKIPDSFNSIEFHHDSRQPYPKGIALKYAIFGSLIGGFLMSIYLIIIKGYGEELSISYVCMVAIFLVIVDFLPFFMTGFVISRRKMRINTKMDYLKIGMIGFLWFALYAFTFMLVTLLLDDTRTHYRYFFTVGSIKILILSVLAGISAMIMAKLVLPKGV